MKKKSEQELYYQFRSELSDESQEMMEFMPTLNYHSRKFRLDFVSKTDYIFLQKIFKQISSDAEKEIDFEDLRHKAEIEVLKIAKIQQKKNITVKEYTEIYDMSKGAQETARGRLHDPLPYHQIVPGGKITYNVEEVEKWRENQYK